MWQVWRRSEVHAKVWWGNLKERDHLQNLTLDRRKILRLILKKGDERAQTGFIWLSIGTCDRLL
jgi:hypothetical protein